MSRHLVGVVRKLSVSIEKECTHLVRGRWVLRLHSLVLLLLLLSFDLLIISRVAYQ